MVLVCAEGHLKIPLVDESRHQISGHLVQNGNANQSAFFDPEHESGETGLENGLNGYERLNGSAKAIQDANTYHRYRGLYDNSSAVPGNYLRVLSREADNASGYDHSRNVSHGYVRVLDYPESLSANQAASVTTTSVSGYTCPRSLRYGYVGVRNYPYPPLYPKMYPNRSVSMTTGSGIRIHQSKQSYLRLRGSERLHRFSPSSL